MRRMDLFPVLLVQKQRRFSIEKNLENCRCLDFRLSDHPSAKRKDTRFFYGFLIS